MTFAQLAKRLSAWTSRGIVSGIILVAGLAFGRQVLQWWGAESREATTPPPSLALGALGDPRQAHLLQFGDSPWRMSRQLVHGDDRQVLDGLQARCAEALGSSAATAGEPGPAERDFLKRVAGEKPAQEKSGQWRLFALEAAIPMVIGTRLAGAKPGPPNDRVASSAERVVTWGLALPMGPKAWTVYTFQAVAPGGGASPFPELPIPPGSRKTLAIAAADGGAVVAFRGLDRRSEWRPFFDSWLSAHGWEMADAWQHCGGAWANGWSRQSGRRRDSLDVVLTSDGTDEMTGLVLLTPASPLETKSP